MNLSSAAKLVRRYPCSTLVVHSTMWIGSGGVIFRGESTVPTETLVGAIHFIGATLARIIIAPGIIIVIALRPHDENMWLVLLASVITFPLALSIDWLLRRIKSRRAR